VNLSSTIEELEDARWDEPAFPSHLVSECHRLRKLPLGRFTIENLRIMLGQNIVRATSCRSPLSASKRIRSWKEHPELRARVAAVAARAPAGISAPACEHGPVVAKAIRKAHEAFQQSV
jgi:hypothetical protein